jgi:hypothetical protein
VAVAVEAAAVKARSGRFGGSVVVRCRQGHLFTTIWIPGASVKALRLAAWRFQRCPVGKHWSIVTPVKAAALSDAERRAAGEARDVRLP